MVGILFILNISLTVSLKVPGENASTHCYYTAEVVILVIIFCISWLSIGSCCMFGCTFACMFACAFARVALAYEAACWPRDLDLDLVRTSLDVALVRSLLTY